MPVTSPELRASVRDERSLIQDFKKPLKSNYERQFMDEKMPKMFFEIHKDLPREGPGDSESTQTAFSMLTDIPESPRILDIGCGPGMQTMDLIKLTTGFIVAVDNHQPYLDALTEKMVEEGLIHRIQVINGDMLALKFQEDFFDLIWAEGSIYIVGFEKGINAWKPFLKEGGYLAVTEVSWLKPDAPEELKTFWENAYPAIQDIEGNFEIIRRAGYEIVGSFTLPESAWWDNYYIPLEQRLNIFRENHEGDDAAMELYESELAEINLYRTYSDYYGYVFYIMQV